MIASDLNNPEFAGAVNPDSRLVVRFHSRAVKNEFETEKQGRPIFADVDYVEIFTPGDTLNIIDTPARGDHKQRFPMHWAHYQNEHGGDSKEIGTPLAQWPLITQAQAEELRGLKFYTVDNVANASDAAITRIGMCAGMSPFAFRDRAKNFLAVSSKESAAHHQDEEEKKLREELEAMKAQNAAMMEQMQKLMAANEIRTERQKPGRKPKEQMEQEAA